MLLAITENCKYHFYWFLLHRTGARNHELPQLAITPSSRNRLLKNSNQSCFNFFVLRSQRRSSKYTTQNLRFDPTGRAPGGSMSQIVGLPNNSYKHNTNTTWVRALLYKLQKGCTRLVATSVYQLLAHGRWFSPGSPASSTTKTGRHVQLKYC